MTEIDFAYFNYEHVLSAYLPCLLAGGVGRRAGRLAAGLSRVAPAVASHAKPAALTRQVVNRAIPAPGAGGRLAVP